MFVWLALAVIAWIFSGGLRRKQHANAAPVIPAVIIITQPPRQPEPPIGDIEVEQMSTMTTNQRTEIMATLHPQQSIHCPLVHQLVGATVLQIHFMNCTAKLRGYVHEAGKIQCNNLQEAGQAYAAESKFYAAQALPLRNRRIPRLAQISPMAARSSARRQRDDRAMSGKIAGKMSLGIAAQSPGNGRTVATAMPPNVRQGGSQDNLLWAERGRATSVPQSARWPAQHLASDLSDSRRQLLAMTYKNYEHTNHTNARS